MEALINAVLAAETNSSEENLKNLAAIVAEFE